MDARPSKKRRLSPTPSFDRATKPLHAHTDGVESPNEDVSTSEDNLDINSAEAGDTSDDDAMESEFEVFDTPSTEVKSGAINGPPRPPGASVSHTARKPNGSGVANVHKNDGVGHAARITGRGVFEQQIDNLLREIKPRLGEEESAAEDTLRTIKNTIENLPDIEPAPVETAERNLLLSSRVAIPFPHPRPPTDARYKLAFSRPSYINVVGSYALKTALDLDGALQIDLVLQMPSSLFTEKDYLNHRYFHKRAYYLACVAAGLQKSKNNKIRLEFSKLNGNSLTPIIRVRPKSQKTENDSRPAEPNWQISIMLSVDASLFPRNRTLPDKNCVRPSTHSGDLDPESFPPTPVYNGSIKVDSSVPLFLKLLHSAASKCAGFRDACYLGRIWLRQRGIGSSIQQGGFGNFEWASLMALLLQSGGRNGLPALESTLSGQHLFSSMVNFLASRNMAKQPLMMHAEAGDKISRVTDVPVLIDGSTGMNILFKMSPWSYKLLQHEARATAKVLSVNRATKFDSIFILRTFEPLHCYDLIARMPLDSNSENPASEQLEKLYNVLSKGLGDRVSMINIALPRVKPWPVNIAPPRISSSNPTIISIRFNADNAARTVDRGPSTEDPKAAASFREFWGTKAELRRFKDGQILESVVWDGRNAFEVTKEIISFLLRLQFGDKTVEKIEFIANDLAEVPLQDQKASQTIDVPAAYKTLESQIRSLEGFPLQIRQIQQSGLWPPSATSGNSFAGNNQISQVVVQFEGSGRWPDDLTAIQMTKIAFLLKMKEVLTDRTGITIARIGIENEDSNMLNKGFIDIRYISGATFRIRIHHDREQALIEKRLADKTLLPRERDETARALSAYKRDFIRAPLYAQAMQKLRTRFPTLPQTANLVQAWFSAHLLSNHVAPRVIDVLTARTFLDPSPWPKPSSVQTGFLRTLLFISRWDWQNEPCIVDFSASMKPADYATVDTRFEAWRKIDPLMNRMALFVATDFDPDGTTWTEFAPAKVVAARMKSLATAASRVVKEKGLDLDMSSLFKTGLSEYDFVLRLDRNFTGRRRQKDEKSKFKNLQNIVPANIVDVGFDPVNMFVEELQVLYGDSAVFFHGQDADVIAGLWSPHTARRAWKVNLTYSTVPIADDAPGEQEEDFLTVAINKEAMLSEMARLGADLISGVEMR